MSDSTQNGSGESKPQKKSFLERTKELAGEIVDTAADIAVSSAMNSAELVSKTTEGAKEVVAAFENNVVCRGPVNVDVIRLPIEQIT